MAKVAYRNRQGRWTELQSIPATKVKNKFGAMLEEAARNGGVAITRHDAPNAVLLSYDEFEALVKQNAQPLQNLSSEFDDWLERQQHPKVRKALGRAFKASPDELGRAALRAANVKNRRGKKRAHEHA